MRRQSLFQLITLLFFFGAHAADPLYFNVTTPPGVIVTSPYGDVTSHIYSGSHRIRLPEAMDQSPLTLTFHGPYGGVVRKTYSPKPDGMFGKLDSGIIGTSLSNPQYLDILPALCPRVADHRGKLIYKAHADLFNHTPVMQLLDPDATLLSRQITPMNKTITHFDCRNTLLIETATVSFDYEDPEQIKVTLADGTVIREYDSGFYANFHIAALPYRQTVAEMPPELLLRVAEGRLSERNRLQSLFSEETLEALSWRTHSFLPGPFLSRNDFFYSLCEWGDTTYQAPRQTMHYENFPIWDWDYGGGQTILVIVWEGDEEDSLVNQGQLPKDAIMDDLVAIFTVTDADTQEGKTYTNPAGTFSIHLKTGDMSECR